MPNIEIHGYDIHDCGEAYRASQVRIIIEKLLQNRAQFPDVATEVVCSNCYCAGKFLPYLRVWDTNEERGRRVTNILRLNGFRVERPVKLADYSEPAMWTQDEIHQDLISIQQQALIVRDTELFRLAESMKDYLKKYSFYTVADFYLRGAREIRLALGDYVPSREQFAKKVMVDPKTCGTGIYSDTSEDGRKLRMTMMVQIYLSLYPDEGLEPFYVAARG